MTRAHWALALATVSLVSACAREVEKAPGTPNQAVEAAAPEAAPGVVELTPAAQREAGIRLAPVAAHAIPLLIETTGVFERDADREAHVTPRIPGRVVRVTATVGTHVAAGAPLAVIESIELGAAQVAYLQARARHDLAVQAARRQAALVSGQVAARKDLLLAQNAERQAAVELDGARNLLLLQGFSAARIGKLASTGKLDPTVPMTAPVAGTVIARHVTLGETLRTDATEPAFVLADPASLWVQAPVPEAALASIRAGQTVTVTTGAFPGRRFPGRVALLDTAFDPGTRTARVRVTVANPRGELRSQMSAHVVITTGTHLALAVPEAAVQEDREAHQTYVFVKATDVGFKQRVVSVGPATGGWRTVLSGLDAGESIVVEGGFTLRSELLKESFGEAE